MITKTIHHEGKEVRLKKVIFPRHIASYAKALTKVKKDCPITISGYPGEGKSVLGIDIAKEYDKRFSYERNCIYGRNELYEKIETLKPSDLLIDEAINALYKREWNKGAHKDLVKLLNICRSKKHLLTFIQPNFTDMDKDIRNERIRLWIFVIRRGVAAVLRPIRSLAGTGDPWNLDLNDDLVKKHVKKLGIFIGTIEGLYRSPNFLGFLRWNDMPEEEYDLYEEVKDRKKYDNDDTNLITPKEAELRTRNRIFQLLAILRSKNFLKKGSYNHIASFLGISASGVSAYIKKAEATQELNNKGNVAEGDENGGLRLD